MSALAVIEGLPQMFDAVVMLTWSNWHSEPRSNRYHYATRFARHVPVLFVQPDAKSDEVAGDKVEGHNIEILHVSSSYTLRQAQALRKALAERKIKRPLVWVYNSFFAEFLWAIPAFMYVYHATEDYVSPTGRFSVTPENISGSVKSLLRKVDLVVAVSGGVAEGYRQHGAYNGEMVVLPNGCDFAFWEEAQASTFSPPTHGRPVALYQGGVNQRLDISLLQSLAERMSDWDFWLCGAIAHDTPGLSKFLGRTNVHYHGQLKPEGVAALGRQASVGLIPFLQDDLIRRSLPLKAYEYLACGLPVVTTPIDALAGRPDLFQFGVDARAFAEAMRNLASTRHDAQCVANRLAAAKEQSYDKRFAEALERIGTIHSRIRKVRQRLNLLVLYDDRSTHIHTIMEHLEAFSHYSRHCVHFLPGTGNVAGFDDSTKSRHFDPYDALLLHYSVRVSIDEHLSPGVAREIAAYDGPKLLFIQDEYDRTETARQWIERLGITAVFTNVPLTQVNLIYPTSRFPAVDFLPTLTGYVPEDPVLDQFAMPHRERPIMIGYRGRRLPHHYGELGQEKYRIGVETKRHAVAAGLKVDIEVDNSQRIHGIDWYRFLGSCRATLGTESGCNVFDEDGELARLSAQHSDISYEAFAAAYLAGREGPVRMNQVSPKIFEAIRLRTALILFAGRYSGVVEPGRHFIELQKDFSNVGEVFEKLGDEPYITALTQQAYDDIVGSERYSYAAFIAEVDAYLEACSSRRPRAHLISAPVLMRPAGGRVVAALDVCPLLLDRPRVELTEARADIVNARAQELAPAEQSSKSQGSLDRGIGAIHALLRLRTGPLHGIARRIWRALPAQIRQRIVKQWF